jgi:DNA invertase Pin-like site-specific DNA recombinase
MSTDDQRLDLQTDALLKAGVTPDQIFTENASGDTTDRPGFIDCFKVLRQGDTLVVWKLDRLGRNLSQLLQTAERLEKKGVRLKCHRHQHAHGALHVQRHGQLRAAGARDDPGAHPGRLSRSA